MLGPLARGAAPARRRAHRRPVVIVLLALLLALLVSELVDQVVKAAKPAAQRGASTWVAAVVPIVGESGELSSLLHEVRRLEHLPACSAVGCQRRAFDADLGQLVSGTAGDLDQLASIGLVPPTSRSARLLERVLEERARAARELAGAVSLLLGSSRTHTTDARVQGELLSVGSRLTASDATYHQFVQSLPGHGRTPPLGPSTWVGDPAVWTRSGVQGWADRLLASQGLRSTAAIALLAVSTNPPVLRIEGLPVPTTTTTTSTTTTTTTSTTTTTTVPGKPTTTTSTTTATTTVPPTTTTLQIPPAGSVSVLQPTSRLSVEVVVANAGSMPASTVTIRAALTTRSGKPVPAGLTSAVSEQLGSLAPGAARYVSLRPIAVHDGETYVLTVSATVPGWKRAVERVVVQVAG